MSVAVPYLWGVPPTAERLHLAVKTGGGIVDKVYWQWDFCDISHRKGNNEQKIERQLRFSI
ncbi:hypothetical protein Bca52824_045039 [Brassica carinata]|uniref:DUF7811 domain-containing protein n=1 Tax=Brassica carinata TaxID=52824 RepID=A0A8X7UMK6_BRACI|nr:hypothetical protein Bca52824_045039 [Brassica carinata]